MVHYDKLPGEELVIPSIELEGVPFSQWEASTNVQFLEANDYKGEDGWRRAAKSSTVDRLKEGALERLVSKASPADEPIFRAALAADKAPVVQVWGAEGLRRLGHKEQEAFLEERSRQAPSFAKASSLVAARLIGQLGRPAPFATLAAALESYDQKHMVAFNAAPFLALHGQEFAPGKKIDMWEFYKKALAQPDERCQNVAIGQLEESKRPEAVELLKAFVAKGPSAPMKYRADEALRNLAATK